MNYQSPCPHCGNSIPSAQATFCPSCGRRLRLSDHRRSSWPSVILALVVFACGLGVYQFSTTTTTTAPPATVPPRSAIWTPSAPPASPPPLLQPTAQESPLPVKPGRPSSPVAPSLADEAESARELPAEEDETETTVYVTRTGHKYHRAGCRYLSRSMIPMSLEDARAQYDPCSICQPPE